MKFKTDENLPTEVAELLRQHGYDAMTVIEQQMSGEMDPVIARVCQAERRVLITLDLDFADIRSYPPEDHAGIIVLRPRSRTIPAIERLAQKLIRVLEDASVVGQLWIVDESHVRIRGEGHP